jgi:oxalate decarboxylase/phosphoglucose isomerase-like protein (cupin superfamily)
MNSGIYTITNAMTGSLYSVSAEYRIRRGVTLHTHFEQGANNAM